MDEPCAAEPIREVRVLVTRQREDDVVDVDDHRRRL
jgi:hypothetical protein